jgi:hypothetical protein
MPKRNPTCFRLASDISTRHQVWVSSNPLTGQGHSAAMIAGAFAEHFANDVAPVAFD